MTQRSKTAQRDETTLPFVKMHGLGNDFVVLDLRAETGNKPLRFDSAAARAIADRRHGVGCDQLIAMEPAHGPDAEIFMRIANADGGEVEACGNATRCVAKLLFDELGRDEVAIETNAGLLTARRAEGDNVRVDMGVARLDWDEIPVARETDTLDLPVGQGPLSHPVGVNIGNPHAVFFVDNAEDIDLTAWGPKLEHDPFFPERANISVAQMLGPDLIRLRVWERGVGITQACGTAACATVVAAARRDLGGREAIVRLDGGDLGIVWLANGHVEMTGPVSTSFTGVLAPGVLAPTG